MLQNTFRNFFNNHEQYRWRIALVLFGTVLVGYFDRLNISFAIPLMASEYNWNEQQVRDNGSLLMGIFYLGYGFSNIFLTPIAAKFGPRKSLIAIMILWSFFTAIGAWVSQFMMIFIASRILLGVSQGVHFPMMAQLTKNWFPLAERAKANSVWISGAFVAVLCAPIILVPMMASYGWRSGFIVLAMFGLFISLPLVYTFIQDTPNRHKGVSQNEIELIQKSGEQEQQLTGATDSLSLLVTSPSFLLLTAIGIFNNIVAIGVSSWIPTYFITQKSIPFADIAWLVSLPYVFSLIGIAIWSYLGDKHNARALIAGLGYLACALMLYLALNANILWIIAILFSTAILFIASFNACEYAIIQRLLPKEKVATGTGVYNGITTMVGGGLGPLVVSPIIGDGDGTWVISAICIVNALMLFSVYRTVKY
ncbi:MFS transporter [Thalassotalea crassostreae]|uniref:MFS transporter n=1 Tax=Thalassotalea crassostreae TaxID=1763536 RepID=UPI000838EBDF|nr:MFS transporter [Thalassotalea crassostreae]